MYMNASSEFCVDDRRNSEGGDMTAANESGQSSNSGGKRETLLSECANVILGKVLTDCIWCVVCITTGSDDWPLVLYGLHWWWLVVSALWFVVIGG